MSHSVAPPPPNARPPDRPRPSPGPFARGLLSRLPEPPRKVALLRASRIGDFICATPAFRALRAALPEAELSLIGLPLVRDLVAGSPHLDRFLECPGYPGIAEQFFDASRTLRFFEQMQAEGFDLAIQMHGSGVYANPVALMLGARTTAGFIRPGDSAGCLDAALAWPQRGHEVQRLLALTTFLGARSRGTQTEFPLWARDHAEAEALLAHAERPLIGLHPAARDAAKRWEPERFAAVGAALRDRYGGTIVLLGSADERTLTDAVARAARGRCLDLAGRTTLGSLGAVIARLAVLLTNDSGPAHIAYALGTPTITIFLATDPARWGPPANGPHRVIMPETSAQPGDDEARAEGEAVRAVLSAAEQILSLERRPLPPPPTVATDEDARVLA